MLGCPILSRSCERVGCNPSPSQRLFFHHPKRLSLPTEAVHASVNRKVENLALSEVEGPASTSTEQTYFSILKLIVNWLLLSNELIVFTALFLPLFSAQIS